MVLIRPRYIPYKLNKIGFIFFSGLVVLAPYSSEDCKSMLKAAIRDPNPVVFLENEILYGKSFEVSEEVLDKDYVCPIGKVTQIISSQPVLKELFYR